MSQIDAGMKKPGFYLFSNKINFKRKYLSNNTQMFFLFS